MSKLTLLEWAPVEYSAGTWDDTPSWKLRNKNVVEEFDMYNEESWKPWPGPHKNVMSWCILESGHAVGWNENPSRGWSFPVVKI